jgi:uncharacterized phage protein (TIGR01671 family)
MREILFRGKRIDNGEWVYGVPWEAVNGTGNWHMRTKAVTDGRVVLIDVAVNPDTIGQFTGLTDKDGRHIFEGDIIETQTFYYGNQKTHTKLVDWDNDIYNDSFGEPFTCGYCIEGGYWKVLGNKWDNLYLLDALNA